jgi:hypothetical protein
MMIGFGAVVICTCHGAAAFACALAGVRAEHASATAITTARAAMVDEPPSLARRVMTRVNGTSGAG